MIDDTESNVSVGSASGESAGEAALIATFYGPRRGQAIENLYEQLYRGLAPKPRGGSVPYWWENREDRAKEIFGRRFAAPGRAAADTTVIQMALNAPHNAAKAWKTMRQNLENVLEAKDLDGLWGYTLIYQAVLKEDVDPDEALVDELRASIRRLSSAESFESLALANVPGGRVWLLAIPDRNNGWAAGTVYCAMGPPKGEKALLNTLYGPAAVLLAPDLIAHKGYYQMRQYRSEDLERSYEEELKDLSQNTTELLQEMEQDNVKQRSALEKLSKDYYQLVPAVSGLKDLHIGMLRQLKNYERWRDRVAGNSVIDFHGDQLEAAAVELEFMAQQLEGALNTADKSVNLAQTQLARDTEHEDQIRHRDVTRLLILVEGTLVAATAALATVEMIAGWKEVRHLLIMGWRAAQEHWYVAIGITISVIAITVILGWRLIQRRQQRTP